MSEQDHTNSNRRHLEILVGPGITLLAVIALLAVARVYDSLPVTAPDCAFRERFSIPCAGCGGTRSMKALANGQILSALRFHPAAVLGVLAAVIWMICAALRYGRGEAPASPELVQRRLLRGSLIALAIGIANWLYLLFFLP